MGEVVIYAGTRWKLVETGVNTLTRVWNMSREVIFFAILPPGPWLLDVNNLNGVLGEDRGMDSIRKEVVNVSGSDLWVWMQTHFRSRPAPDTYKAGKCASYGSRPSINLKLLLLGWRQQEPLQGGYYGQTMAYMGWPQKKCAASTCSVRPSN